VCAGCWSKPDSRESLMDGQEQPKPGNSELNGGGRSGWRGDRVQVPEFSEPCVFGDMYRVRFLF
jgi:hypothetical protein